MEQTFKREERYVVLKHKDITAANLTAVELAVFDAICNKITAARIKRGKRIMDCVVVEKGWPEYEPTWAAIQKRYAKEG